MKMPDSEIPANLQVKNIGIIINLSQIIGALCFSVLIIGVL